MKNNNLIQIKLIAIPSLLFMIVGFGAIFLINRNPILVLGIEFINFIIYMFLINIKLRGYKLKYLFLGRKFKNQLEEYKKYIDGADINRSIIKWKKDTYRKTGKILSDDEFTPSYFIWRRYESYFLYDRAIVDEDYVLCVLNEHIETGGGLYQIFEMLCRNFTYIQYKDLIIDSKKYSLELKTLLLNPNYEKIYQLITLEETSKQYFRSEEDDLILSQFEKEESNKIDNYSNEIHLLFLKTAIDLYVAYHRKNGLPKEYSSLYFSKDNRKRIYLFQDKNLNSYSGIEDEFEFEGEKKDGLEKEFNSRGYWMPIKQFGHYETIELLKKDIRYILIDFIEDKQ